MKLLYLHSILSVSIFSFCVCIDTLDNETFIRERCSDRLSQSIQCSDPNAKCFNWTENEFGYCDCVEGFGLPDPSVATFRTRCVRPIEVNDRCTNSLECLLRDPYSTCSPRGFCECLSFRFRDTERFTNKCFNLDPSEEKPFPLAKGKPEKCTKDTDCSDSKAECVHRPYSYGACECKGGLVPITYRKCVEIIPIGSWCSYDTECKLNEPHSYCSVDPSICKCQEGWIYGYDEGKCIELIDRPGSSELLDAIELERWIVVCVAVGVLLLLFVSIIFCVCRCKVKHRKEFRVCEQHRASETNKKRNSSRTKHPSTHSDIDYPETD